VTDGDLPSEAGQPTPERVADLVRSLATVMRQSGVTEMDLNLGAVEIRLRRPYGGDAIELVLPGSKDAAAMVAEKSTSHLLTAPMVGTFYSSPTSSAPPFVAVGDHVSAGQTVGIIEAMKIMNEIAADRSGVVEEFLAGNAQPVEYGSPLIRLIVDREDRY
jgi:acetyl-CoA carboxylase biotin carboxyl carrier protein